VSLVFELLVIAGGIATGRWLAHRMRPRPPSQRETPDAASNAPEFDAFPCRLGDVVVRTAERDEAWLSGALVFEEQRPVAALFMAPDAGAHRAVLAHEAEEGLTWLSPLELGELLLPREIPLTIEHAGVRFERFRRVPVRVRTVGNHAPKVGDHAVVAEYRGRGAERLVVVVGAEQTWAGRGIALQKSDFDVLPGQQDDEAAPRR
jgi:hypothetical protein